MRGLNFALTGRSGGENEGQWFFFISQEESEIYFTMTDIKNNLQVDFDELSKEDLETYIKYLQFVHSQMEDEIK